MSLIGGMFGLDGVSPHSHLPLPSHFIGENSLFLANARSGIAVLVSKLSPPTVWMPSYLCGVMAQAVDSNISSIRFYEVDYDLEIPSLEWISDVHNGDLVVFIDYFGFPICDDALIAVKKRGAWVLEDASHSLLSKDVSSFSDFVLFSPRKFLGIPDGGILLSKCNIDLSEINLKEPPSDWWLIAFSASLLRREFDLCGGDKQWFRLFREADENGPIGPYAMSQLSTLLFKFGFRYDVISEKRIRNYRVLLQGLKHIALFQDLPDGVVPIGFPVKLADRDGVRQVLFNHGVYPPVHWDIIGVVPESFSGSHRLAADIMTLPCDHRYSEDDMQRILEYFR